MKTKRLWMEVCLIFSLILLLSGCRSGERSLGTGVYPGDPDENFAPVLKPDNDNYRNIAKLRTAYHSSSYDYNLTAQLVTDGIIDKAEPAYFLLTLNDTAVAKSQREFLFDHVSGSAVEGVGNNLVLQYTLGDGNQPPEISSVALNGEMIFDKGKPGPWQIRLSGSNENTNWETLKEISGTGFPGTERPDPFAEYLKNPPKDSTGKPIDPFESFFGPRNPGEPRPSFSFQYNPPEPARLIRQVFDLNQPVSFKSYRIEFITRSAKKWQIGDLDFFLNEKPVELAPSQNFHSAWMSGGSGNEWIMVDLGSYSTFDRIRLHWINKAKSGKILVSADAISWKEIGNLPGNNQPLDEISFENQAKARYIKIQMTEPSKPGRYILSEFEVLGKGGLIAEPQKLPPVKDGRLYLSGGNWKVQRSSFVKEKGESISGKDYDASQWIVATVPGTVLVSYINAGALPDPNFGDNQTQISESFFTHDFWYRNEFEVPRKLKGEHIFLNFDGINWKADVFVNGRNAGRIEGAFIRGRFDVSELLKPGEKNAIAVLIHKNDNPGAVTEQGTLSPDRNGGILGADNPTFHASIGWDWIPTIRGRNIGIWNDVYLSSTGPVDLSDPFAWSDLALPDTTAADIHIQVTVRNISGSPVNGTLEGKYGDTEFEEIVSLNAGESKVIALDPSNHPELKLSNPKLWWPNGYGHQNLYDVSMEFVTDRSSSDRVSFKSGIREMSYTMENNILKMFINGRRFIARGGNWGFPESNLLYRAREYDIAVAYHADMNFTMIRNWVAQTGDEEFFEACDKHGIMVWQDFCLANPADGPDPNDPAMFNKNADDVIRKIRNHPSIAIYVGRNEGDPPPVIDTALRNMVKALHPGMLYIPNSAGGSVSGGGPYRALPVKDYYLLYGRNKLHSERGMPNVMNYESLEQMLPDSNLWPQNSMWGLHDYTLEGAQSAASFNEMIEKGFGPPADAKEFTQLAQFVNYDGYRAMFEGRSQYRMGLLLWMSHSAWPSMVWQTYDYYFDPTAGYFGCKKASEPLHIQWNRVYDDVEVVNLNAKDQQNLTARAQIFNLDGKIKQEKQANLNSKEDATDKVFKLEFPGDLSDVYFLKLTLLQGERIISENFYWAGKEEGNYRALNDLEPVILKNTSTMKRSGDIWTITTTLENNSEVPALMIRLKVIGKSKGERILPAFFSDNYISLMPGEKKVITARVNNADTQGEKPVVVLSGYNVGE